MSGLIDFTALNAQLLQNDFISRLFPDRPIRDGRNILYRKVDLDKYLESQLVIGGSK